MNKWEFNLHVGLLSCDCQKRRLKSLHFLDTILILLTDTKTQQTRSYMELTEAIMANEHHVKIKLNKKQKTETILAEQTRLQHYYHRLMNRVLHNAMASWDNSQHIQITSIKISTMLQKRHLCQCDGPKKGINK